MKGDDTTVRRHRPLRSNALVDHERVRRVTKDGREYLTFPTVPLREMVLNYPENGTQEFMPAENIEETAHLWGGTPLTYVHPDNERQTARDPDSYTSEVIGQVHEPEYDDGVLKAEGWIDVEKANAIGGMAAEVVDKLSSGEDLAVSAGYHTVEDRRASGTYDGESYDLEQGAPIPDHLAVFPSDTFRARCDLEDGCGAPRANAVVADDAGSESDTMQDASDDTPPDLGTIRRVLNHLPGGTVEHEHGDEECTCGGTCDDCTTNASGSNEEESGDDPSGEDGEAADEDTGADDSTPSDDTNTMDDDTINTLAEQSSFSEDQLHEWNDDELDALEETLDSESEPSGENAQPDADPGTDAEGAETATAKQNTDASGETEEMLQQLIEDVEELKANQQSSEYEEEIEIVTNALDGMTRSAAESLAQNNPDDLESLAEEHRDESRIRANYGAVPGPVDRSPDTSDPADEFPAGGRSEWESRSEGGDN